MAEAVLTRRSVVKNEYELLADITVSSATTNVDITGLNIGKDEEIVLVADVYNPTTSSPTYSLYFNGNVTSTNYYTQYIYVSNTTISANRVNNANIFAINNINSALVYSKIELSNSGYCLSQNDITREYVGSLIVLQSIYQTSTFTSTLITSLRIASSISNAIGIGSRFKLYKVAK